MDILTIAIRFLLVFILASLFGLERQRTHKPVGFGPFVFVSLGACALAIISLELSIDNPLPLLAAIVTSIGFLVAGALIKTSEKTFGFTTAASIWAFAIFGLIIGLGAYTIAITLYVLMWILILIDLYFEKHSIGSHQLKLTILTKMVNEKEIEKIVEEFTSKNKLIGMEINKRSNNLIMTYIVEGTKENINKIPRTLYKKPWFNECRIE